MGLDTTHDCWHGAYSAFSRWRTKLAEIAGYWIADVKGGLGYMPTVMIDWGHLKCDRDLLGEWEETPTDPLIVLIAHSDCEGVIHPEQAKPLMERLKELLPLLPDEDAGGHIGNWREKTQQFIDGLENAISQNEDVEFQ